MNLLGMQRNSKLETTNGFLKRRNGLLQTMRNEAWYAKTIFSYFRFRIACVPASKVQSHCFSVAGAVRSLKPQCLQKTSDRAIFSWQDGQLPEGMTTAGLGDPSAG